MSERQWTQSQQDAIRARGGTLLVSAAAGSGKTAVLVQRVIERLTDPEHPSDADRLLIVTFTRAAAAEMRERIAQSLAQALAADPGNRRLQRQQILLDKAQISTVHSFCSELARENYYRLDLSPDFRILDERELSVLRQDAVARAMGERYEAGDPDFLDLLEAFGTGRDDARLAQTVENLYDFVRAHPFPARWLREKAALYRSPAAAEETPWGRCVLRFAKDALEYCASLTRGGLREMRREEKLDAAYRGAFASDLAQLERLLGLVERSDWDAAFAALQNFSYQRLGTARGLADDPLKEKLKACRAEVKDTVERLQKSFCGSREECAADIRALAGTVESLFSLTVRFSQLLDESKRARKAADFGDLEHWALRVLVEETPDGYRRTPVAEALSARFDEIMVDEYQDTNEAQDLIFRAVSKQEGNLFLVGDVKQSIYSFRQAMPGIFLARRAAFPPYDREEDRYPASLALDRNFRSRREVTSAVNFVFGQLMSREAGDVDYRGEERLQPGAVYPEAAGFQTELLLTDARSGEGGEAEDRMEILEARQIAALIRRKMAEGFQVTERGALRPARFRDFCILLRSSNRFAPVYARELQKCGVPAWTDVSGGFFHAAEVAYALSFLRAVDNPMQDIPLASVLMGPACGFTPDDMARLRRAAEGALYQALLTAARRGGERERAVLGELERYRALAAALPADRLVNAVYDGTGFLALARAMPGGEVRVRNLRLLLEYAKSCERAGSHGLSAFLRFIGRLQEQGGDLDAAPAVSESADVVRIMSVHKSKGLEFPVCILAGCARRFPKDHGDALLHAELGLGAKRRDPQLACRYTTLPREAVALEQERGQMSEELRVLYVAMTRAKEKLILLATFGNLDRKLGELAARLTDGPAAPPYAVRSVSSIADWLLLCALRLPEGAALRERAQSEARPLEGTGPAWEICISPPVEASAGDAAPCVEEAPPPDPRLRRALEERLGYRYPYRALQSVPAKVAASELALRETEEEFLAMARPGFLGKKGLTPAERGTAAHAFLQFAVFPAAARSVEEERDRLVRQGFLTQAQADALELPKLRGFFRSGLMARILSSPAVWREYRFTVEIPAGDVEPGLPPELRDEPVVLQGAVDCIFEEDGALVIVDYKTDHVKDPAALWGKYAPQVRLYRAAVEQCLGRRVKECLLYSLALGCAAGPANGEIPS